MEGMGRIECSPLDGQGSPNERPAIARSTFRKHPWCSNGECWIGRLRVLDTKRGRIVRTSAGRRITKTKDSELTLPVSQRASNWTKFDLCRNSPISRKHLSRAWQVADWCFLATDATTIAPAFSEICCNETAIWPQLPGHPNLGRIRASPDEEGNIPAVHVSGGVLALTAILHSFYYSRDS